jgi:predicted DsbA family dithiol-disulfide isomerase
MHVADEFQFAQRLQHGCQDAVVEALFVAYFNEGRDISNRTTLIDVVVEAGLERQVVEG